MIEFGLYFGSIFVVPFAVLTILMVEFWVRKKPGSLIRLGVAVFISPALITLLSVGFITFRRVFHEGSGVDIGLVLAIPLGVTMILMSTIFSVIYVLLRTDIISQIEHLSSETWTKIILIPILVFVFLFLYFASFFSGP